MRTREYTGEDTKFVFFDFFTLTENFILHLLEEPVLFHLSYTQKMR